MLADVIDSSMSDISFYFYIKNHWFRSSLNIIVTLIIAQKYDRDYTEAL